MIVKYNTSFISCNKVLAKFSITTRTTDASKNRRSISHTATKDDVHDRKAQQVRNWSGVHVKIQSNNSKKSSITKICLISLNSNNKQ